MRRAGLVWAHLPAWQAPGGRAAALTRAPAPAAPPCAAGRARAAWATRAASLSAGVEVHGGSDGAAAAWADRSLREAYDANVLKTYVAHSLTITTALNAAGVENSHARVSCTD